MIVPFEWCLFLVPSCFYLGRSESIPTIRSNLFESLLTSPSDEKPLFLEAVLHTGNTGTNVIVSEADWNSVFHVFSLYRGSSDRTSVPDGWVTDTVYRSDTERFNSLSIQLGHLFDDLSCLINLVVRYNVAISIKAT